MVLEGGEMAQSSVSVYNDLSLDPWDSSRKAECSDTISNPSTRHSGESTKGWQSLLSRFSEKLSHVLMEADTLP